MSDLIDEWAKNVEPYIDAPRPFIEAAGYHLVSDLLGRYFQCVSMPSKRPNLWMLISCIPGRGRRSSLQGLADKVTEPSLMQFYEAIKKKPRFKEQKEKDKFDALTDEEKQEFITKYHYRMIARSSIEQGTPEGIGDAVSNYPYKVWRIVSTEMSGVFRRMSLNHNTGTEALLSKLYYGEGGSTLLSGKTGRPKERIIPRGLYVTMFAGMQQPKECLTEGMVYQGLLRRLMIIYVEDFGDNWLPPLNFNRYEVEDLCKTLSTKISSIMYEIVGKKKPSEPIDIMFDPSVYDKINDFARILDENVSQDPSLPNIYKQSLWEHLAKLSLNRTIAGISLGKIQNGGLKDLVVSLKDFKKASKFLKPLMDKAEQLIDSLGREQEVLKPRDSDIDRVIRYLKGGGREGLTRTQLSRKMGSPSADKLDNLVTTLIQHGRIRYENRVGKGGGTRYYVE